MEKMLVGNASCSCVAVFRYKNTGQANVWEKGTLQQASEHFRHSMRGVPLRFNPYSSTSRMAFHLALTHTIFNSNLRAKARDREPTQCPPDSKPQANRPANLGDSKRLKKINKIGIWGEWRNKDDFTRSLGFRISLLRLFNKRGQKDHVCGWFGGSQHSFQFRSAHSYVRNQRGNFNDENLKISKQDTNILLVDSKNR